MKSQSLQETAMFGAPLALSAGASNSEEWAVGEVARVRERVRRFQSDLEVVNADPDLTETGKASRRRALAEAAHLDLGQGAWDNGGATRTEQMKTVRLQRNKLAAKLAAVSQEPDSAARAVREVFLWQRFEAIDPLARPAAFADAIKRGDRESFLAWSSAPQFLGLLEPAVVAQGQAAWGEVQDPEQASQLRNLDRALSAVETDFATGCRVIAKAGGLPESDPLQAISAGEPPASL